MNYKPSRIFDAVEGEYSRDNAGPEALKADLDQLMKMFDPTSVHDNGEPGGIGADNLNFRLDDEETSAGIGSAEIEGLTADNNVYAQLSAIVNILLTHTNLADPTTMSHIGGTLNGTESNGQSIIDTLYQMVVDRYSKSVVDSLIAENTNVAITGLSYNADTGVLTATAKGGTVTQVFDLNIEKIPVSVGFVEVENVTYIRITNTDGTYTQSAITDFVTQYSFNDSTEVDFTVTNATGRNKSITATIKDASIKKKHLDSAVISEMESYAESAGISAASASVSAGNASTSEANALQYKASAEGSASAASASAGSATNSATTASQKADLATEKATLAESYAHGGTGTRPGEDTDNAEYYYRQAAGIAGGDYVTHPEYNADMATIADNIQSAIDLAGGADAKAEAVGTYTVNGKQLKSNPVLNAGDVGAVPTTRKINGKVLSADIVITSDDVGATSKTDFTTEDGKVKSLFLNGTNYEFAGGNSVHIGSDEPTSPDVDLWIDPNSTGNNVVDNLKSDSMTDMLSARQGKVLKSIADGIIETVDSKADKAQISNRNLLDNPWFTINQRGQSSYSSYGYTVDRWIIPAGMTVIVGDNGVTISSTTAYYAFATIIEKPRLILGKEYTFSTLFADGTITHTTFTYTGQTNFEMLTRYNSEWHSAFRTNGDVIELLAADANVENPAPITIRAVKLEVGSVSTLHLDVPPNYAEELLKCQRYYVELNEHYYEMVMHTSTAAVFRLSLPTKMRDGVLPSVNFNAMEVREGSTWYSINVSNVEYHGDNQFISLFLYISRNMSAGGCYEFYNKKITLSADL